MTTSPSSWSARQLMEPVQASYVELNIPADYAYLGVVSACMRAILASADNVGRQNNLTYNVELAVHEVCTNIVEHAYAGLPGRIEVHTVVEPAPERLVVTLSDTGRAFALPEIEQPDPARPRIKGYGLFLLHELMDQVDYYPESGQNRWRLVKYLTQ